jgi:transcriptional regulator with GAF, ATPase, and Fis domain
VWSMNASLRLSRVQRSPKGIESGPTISDPKRPVTNGSVTKAPFKSAKAPTVLEARIGSLKILALTLLHAIEALEDADGDGTAVLDLRLEVHRFEAELIRSALIRTGGRQRLAARLLGMKVTTLNTKIRRYGIEP